MQIKTVGHEYSLSNVEGGEQTLSFIRKERGPQGADPKTLLTISNGTTNEEVLAVLIDRLKFLYAKLPDENTAGVISRLEEALMLLETRTQDRLARGVEGTDQM